MGTLIGDRISLLDEEVGLFGVCTVFDFDIVAKHCHMDLDRYMDMDMDCARSVWHGMAPYGLLDT
jgi:hypothetical protein